MLGVKLHIRLMKLKCIHKLLHNSKLILIIPLLKISLKEKPAKNTIKNANFIIDFKFIKNHFCLKFFFSLWKCKIIWLIYVCWSFHFSKIFVQIKKMYIWKRLISTFHVGSSSAPAFNSILRHIRNFRLKKNATNLKYIWK